MKTLIIDRKKISDEDIEAVPADPDERFKYIAALLMNSTMLFTMAELKHGQTDQQAGDRILEMLINHVMNTITTIVERKYIESTIHRFLMGIPEWMKRYENYKDSN